MAKDKQKQKAVIKQENNDCPYEGETYGHWNCLDWQNYPAGCLNCPKYHKNKPKP